MTIRELRDALSQYPDGAAVHCDSYFLVVSHDGRYHIVAELPAPEDVETAETTIAAEAYLDSLGGRVVAETDDAS